MPPSLVLLPGMDGTGDMFEPLLRSLSGSLNSVVVRYPATEPLGYAALTSLARAALPKGEPYIVLGESFSGPIAVTLAAEAHKGLVGLILCASFVSNPMPWFRPLGPLLSLLPIRPALRLFGPSTLFGRHQTEDLRELFFATARRVSATVLLVRIRDALEIDVSSLLAAVRVPAMYIRATRDALLTEAAAERFSRFAPKAKVVRIDAPHGVLQCAPDEAAQAILEFVRSVSLASNYALE